MFINVLLSSICVCLTLGLYSQQTISSYTNTEMITLSANGVSNLYSIGWSEKGKFAFIQSQDHESVVVIFNNVTDRVIWSMPLISDAEVSKKEIELIDKAFLSNGIVRSSNCQLNDFPIVISEDIIDVNLDKKETIVEWTKTGMEDSFEVSLVHEYSLFLKSSKQGWKLITAKKDESEPSLIIVKGYIKSPFEGRIFILVQFEYFNTMTEEFETKMSYYGSNTIAHFHN